MITATQGLSALHRHQTVLQGRVEVVRLLIGAGGQRLLFLTDKHGFSPLLYEGRQVAARCKDQQRLHGGGRRHAARTRCAGGHAAAGARGQGRVGRVGAGEALWGRWRRRGRRPPWPSCWLWRRSRKVRRARSVAAVGEGWRGAARARAGPARRSEGRRSVHPHNRLD